MPVIRLSIARDGDGPPWPDIALGRKYTHLDGNTSPLSVAVIEHGTESGTPAVMLRFELPDGRTVVAETSLDAWITATSGMRGAFPASFAGGPLAPPG